MQEWEAGFYAYREAQSRIANAAAYLALKWWVERVARLRGDATPMYLSDLTGVVAGARRLSRRLSHSWYQYHRALETGELLGDHEQGLQSLHQVRQNFLDRLQDAAMLGEQRSDDDDEVFRWFEDRMMQSDWATDEDNPRQQKLNREQLDQALQRFLDSWTSEDRQLGREDHQWPRDTDFNRLREEVERQVREIARESTEDQQRRLRIREDQRGERASDEEQDTAHERVGQRIAGKVVSLVSDAPDQNTRNAVDRDRLVMAVARGTAASPCAFCAMLASRGPVYRSVDAAGFGSGFSKAHDNCQCYPIVYFRRVNLDNRDDWPQRNLELRDIWDSIRDAYPYADRDTMLARYRQRLQARGMGQ